MADTVRSLLPSFRARMVISLAQVGLCVSPLESTPTGRPPPALERIVWALGPQVVRPSPLARGLGTASPGRVGRFRRYVRGSPAMTTAAPRRHLAGSSEPFASG
jgi:hypothetical protein